MASEFEVVSALAACFFATLPLKYRTYCSLTSHVAREVMRRFGFAWDLLPCQLWYTTPERNHIVGFVGQRGPGKWDGHVICASKDRFFDAALHHLHVELAIEAPTIVVGSRFNVPSQTIARHDLNAGDRLWWLHPPSGVDARPPEEPVDLIDTLAGSLEEQVRLRLLKLSRPIAPLNSPAAGRPAR